MHLRFSSAVWPEFERLHDVAKPRRSEERLDSWKLYRRALPGRTVRTVQRWEREQGLPVVACSTLSIRSNCYPHYDYAFEPLRSDPRFIEVIRSLVESHVAIRCGGDVRIRRGHA